MTIINYQHRRKPKRPKAQPAVITGSAIVSARHPKKHLSKRRELPDDPAADARVDEFFRRMGLTVPRDDP